MFVIQFLYLLSSLLNSLLCLFFNQRLWWSSKGVKSHEGNIWVSFIGLWFDKLEVLVPFNYHRWTFKFSTDLNFLGRWDGYWLSVGLNLSMWWYLMFLSIVEWLETFGSFIFLRNYWETNISIFWSNVICWIWVTSVWLRLILQQYTVWNKKNVE